MQQRMYQTEQFEQLVYHASFIQGFCRAQSSHMRHRDGETRLAEFIGKLVAAPNEIEAVLQVFENNCQFKTLHHINAKLGGFFKLALHEPEGSFERLKLLLQRMGKVVKSLENFIGLSLKDCPGYDAVINFEAKSEAAFFKKRDDICPVPGLSRKRQLNWYIKLIDYYS